MSGLRSTKSSDLHDRQIYTIVKSVTKVRGHCRNHKSRLTVSLIYESGCFLGFSDDVTAATSVFSAACTLVSEVKTHCLRTSVSFLLRVTS